MQEQVKYATIIRDHGKLPEVIISDDPVAIGCDRSIYRDATISFNKVSQSVTIFGEHLEHTHCRYVAMSKKWHYLGTMSEWSGVNDAEIYFLNEEEKEKFLNIYTPFLQIYKKEIIIRNNKKATWFSKLISLFSKKYVHKESFDCVSDFLINTKGKKEMVNLEEYILRDVRDNKMRASDSFNQKIECLKDVKD